MYPGLREKFRRLEQLGWFIPGGLPVKYDLVGPKGRSYVKAAVLFVISRNHDGELQVLLTKRSHSVRTHKGWHNRMASRTYPVVELDTRGCGLP